MSDHGGFLNRILSARADSQGRTILVATLVSGIAALLVSAAALTLEPRIDANRAAERQAKLDALIASLPGLSSLLEGAEADTLESMVVDLSARARAAEGEFPATDLAALAADPATSTELSDDQDIAGIGRRPDFAEIHVLRDAGRPELVILPMLAAGYQSQIKAYLALEGDMSTVAGFVVTEQGETPGLGAKITEPSWQALWPGKQIRGEDGKIRFEVVRGKASTEYEVDGITGATRTSNAVGDMIRFWMGPMGYGPILAAIEDGEF